jgi:hypothetical protein
MKIRFVGSVFFHAEEETEGQTDRQDEPNSFPSQFY